MVAYVYDDELLAMNTVHEAVKDMHPQARKRVFDWAEARCSEMQLIKPDAVATGDAS